MHQHSGNKYITLKKIYRDININDRLRNKSFCYLASILLKTNLIHTPYFSIPWQSTAKNIIMLLHLRISERRVNHTLHGTWMVFHLDSESKFFISSLVCLKLSIMGLLIHFHWCITFGVYLTYNVSLIVCFWLLVCSKICWNSRK